MNGFIGRMLPMPDQTPPAVTGPSAVTPRRCQTTPSCTSSCSPTGQRGPRSGRPAAVARTFQLERTLTPAPNSHYQVTCRDCLAAAYAVNFPAELIAAVARAVHLEPDQSWVSDEACAAAALEAAAPALRAQGAAAERERCLTVIREEAAEYHDISIAARDADDGATNRVIAEALDHVADLLDGETDE